MKNRLYIIAGVGAVVVIALSWLSYHLKSQNSRLMSTVAEQTRALADKTHENSDLTDALTNAQGTITAFEAQINNLSSTVGSLVKLKDTDRELLQKYSKVYFLSDNYVPRGLADIDTKYRFDNAKPLQFLSKAEPHLYAMIDDARSAGLDLSVDSAYRSFATQSGLKSAYTVTYGKGTANSFSADQGYSEHQLGTAVDLTTSKIGGGLAGFDKTNEYDWLTKNAYKYGFILSYPKGNDYYVFEPWHWRFVGVALALRLHEERENFVDLEQRQLDPYLVNIFD